jgi:hypothetical protein
MLSVIRCSDLAIYSHEIPGINVDECLFEFVGCILEHDLSSCGGWRQRLLWSWWGLLFFTGLVIMSCIWSSGSQNCVKREKFGFESPLFISFLGATSLNTSHFQKTRWLLNSWGLWFRKSFISSMALVQQNVRNLKLVFRHTNTTSCKHVSHGSFC